MFTIIGGDGREYGPATAETIRSWMAAGRANADTKAKAIGSDEWRTLGDFPEFATPEGAPPVITAEVQTDLAERDSRFFAFLADFVIQVFCMLPGTIVLGVQGLQAIISAMQTGDFRFLSADVGSVRLGASLLAAAMITLAVVQIVLLSTRGQSLGKMMLGIRIVRTDGSSAGFVRAWLLRECVPFLIKVLFAFIPLLGVILRLAFSTADCLFIFRADRRCIHDHIAGTKVVKVQRSVETEPQG